MLLYPFFIIFGSALLIFLYKIWTNCKSFENARKKITKWMPAALRIPILGSIFEFGNNAELLINFSRLTDNASKSVFFDIVGEWNILTKEHDLIEFILTSTKILNKSGHYQFFIPWLGNGLLLQPDANKWKKNRRIITPTFHFSILEQFVGIFNSNGDIMVEKLKLNALNKEKVDMNEYLESCTLDIICESAMGVSVNSQTNEANDEYIKAVKSMCTIIENRIFSAWKWNDFLFKFSQDYRTQCKSLRILHDFTDSVIKQRRKELHSKNKDNNLPLIDNLGRKRKITFLDLLISSSSGSNGNSLTDEEIRDEVDTFMFGGHDTTSSALASALYALSKEQKIQNLVRDELKQIIGENRDRSITYQDLQELKYLDLVVKETLRMYPPVPLIARRTEEEIYYKGNIIPKDTFINIYILGLNNDPDYHENPEVFNPDRFLDTNNKKPFANIPFSAGPRNCIGQKFALLELKTIISKIISNFEVLPTNPPQKLILISNVTLKMQNGLNIRLRKCNWD